MRFNKNEIELLREFSRYEARVRISKRWGKNINYDYLKNMKWGFKQDFLAGIVNNKITPINRVLDEEIKHWARLYRTHQLTPDRFYFNNIGGRSRLNKR